MAATLVWLDVAISTGIPVLMFSPPRALEWTAMYAGVKNVKLCPSAAEMVSMARAEIISQYPQYSGFDMEVQGWVPYLHRLFRFQKIGRMLEFGVGSGTGFLLDHCGHVVSMELTMPGYPWPWDNSCIERFKKRGNWTFIDRECGKGLVKADEECVHGQYPADNSPYIGEIDTLVAEALKKGPFDMIFVDPAAHARADFINQLFGKTDIIATHDTAVSAEFYGWDKIREPENYEKISPNLGGHGVIFWINKSKPDLIRFLKSV